MSIVDFDSLDLGDRLGKGGQGSVHRVLNRQLNQQWAVVYKEYLPTVLPSVRINALRQMAELVPSLPYADGVWLSGETSWPAALVEKQGQISGFLMRAVPDEFQFRFQPLGASGATRRLANFEFLLNPDEYVANIGLRISERDRLRLLAAVASTLDRLHGLGIAVGDLSPKNLLFSTAPEVKCFVIDCDAMRLHGVSAMEQVETPGWQIPQGEEKATSHSDAYKFGLLAIRLFARDQASKDTDALARINPELGRLARESLSDDVTRRPPPGGWIDDLKITASKASTLYATAVASGAGQAPGGGYQGHGPSAPFVIGPLATTQTAAAAGGPNPQVPGLGTYLVPQRRRRRRVSVAAGLLLLGALGTVIGVYNANHASGVANSSNYVNGPSDGTGYTPYTTTQTSEFSPSPTAPSPSPSPVQTTVGTVQIAPAITADPRAAQVAQMFDAYFSGIDQKNYPQALAQYDPNGVINPNDSNQARQFEQGVSTSDDTDVLLLDIQPGDPSSPVTRASLTFQSTQAAGMGPADNPGETCTDWSLTYSLTQSSSGGYLISNTPVASDKGC